MSYPLRDPLQTYLLGPVAAINPPRTPGFALSICRRLPGQAVHFRTMFDNAGARWKLGVSACGSRLSEQKARMTSDVGVHAVGRVTTITLNRPEKRNAITTEMYLALREALDAAVACEARIVILTGAGGVFTAGNDLDDMRRNAPTGPTPPPVRFLDALTSCDALVIAMVDGPAIGIGTTVLLHCDLVYATQRSSFRFPFIDLGLVPEAASTLLLPRMVGHQRATELMVFGRPFTAEHAYEIGMVNEVFVDAETMRGALEVHVDELLNKPHAAMRALKRLLRDESASSVGDRLDLDRQVMQSLLGL